MKLAAYFLIGLGQIAAAQAGTVVVIVEEVESASGTVNVGLCDKSLSREDCLHSAELPAEEGTMEFIFESIPPGTYAAVGYHDENGNGEFDRTLGIPQEPYALSNDAAERTWPTFRDAAMPIALGENRVTIALQRFFDKD